MHKNELRNDLVLTNSITVYEFRERTIRIRREYKLSYNSIMKFKTKEDQL